jgi:hypothetical protein
MLRLRHKPAEAGRNLDRGYSLDLAEGNLGLVTGNFVLVAGNLDLVAGNLDLEAGNLDLVTGNLDLVAGNLDLVAGNLDLVAGNLDLVADCQKYRQQVQADRPRAQDLVSDSEPHHLHTTQSLQFNN